MQVLDHQVYSAVHIAPYDASDQQAVLVVVVADFRFCENVVLAVAPLGVAADIIYTLVHPDQQWILRTACEGEVEGFIG